MEVDAGCECGHHRRQRVGNLGADTDPRNGGDQSRDSLVKKLGQLPYTMTTRTGGGGTHEYFRWPKDFDLPVAMQLGEEYPGLDIVGEGHVLVAPPSYHFTSGRRYEWEPELNPTSSSRLMRRRRCSR